MILADENFQCSLLQGIEIVDPELGGISILNETRDGVPLVASGAGLSWRDSVYISAVPNRYAFAAYVEDPTPEDNGTDGDEVGWVVAIDPYELQASDSSKL